MTGPDNRPLVDKLWSLAMVSADPGEAVAARDRALAAEGVDGHAVVDRLAKARTMNGGRIFTEAEVLELQKQAFQRGRDIEKIARGQDPDEIDWLERVHHLMRFKSRFKPKTQEFIENMAEHLQYYPFADLSPPRRKYLIDLWLQAHRW